MSVIVRKATPEDAKAMCAVINPIIAEGSTTAHRNPFDIDRMIHHYIAPETGISCMVAEADGRILGYQALDGSHVPERWGSIGSFVSPKAQGMGLGHRLFAATREAAQAAGLIAIDATIRADNLPGLGFYSRLGFVDYDRIVGLALSDGMIVDRIRKRYDLQV